MTLKPIALSPTNTPGIVHAKHISEESANIASRCLQANRANHIFTSSEKEMGAFLHNHITYHVLALYALGASPQTILAQTKRNSTYQLLPPKFAEEETVKKMLSNQDFFNDCVGKEEHFLDFCEFYEREIERYGAGVVLRRYVMGDTGKWDGRMGDLGCRMYHGYVHGLMHIGQGLEFNLPSIMAEGLAEATVHHDAWYTEYIRACEDEALNSGSPSQSLYDCIQDCLKDKDITSCVAPDFWGYANQWEAPSEAYPDGRWFVTREPFRDGVVGKVKKQLSKIAGKWRVGEHDDLEKKTAELINISAFIASMSQRAPYESRYDFFLIHGSNACLWHSVFLSDPSFTPAQKARLIATSAYIVLFMWVGMGCPTLNVDYAMAHEPKVPNSTWEDLFARVCLHEDDGHMIKLVRALKNAEDASQKYDGLREFPMKQDMFLKAAHAAVDSGSKQPMQYVQHFDLIRMAGAEGAWGRVPHRTKRQTNGDEEKVNGTDGVALNGVQVPKAPVEGMQMPKAPLDGDVTKQAVEDKVLVDGHPLSGAQVGKAQITA